MAGLSQEIFEGIQAARGVKDAFDYSEQNYRNEMYKIAKRENDDWDERRKAREQAEAEAAARGVTPTGPAGVQTIAAAGMPGTNQTNMAINTGWQPPPASIYGGNPRYGTQLPRPRIRFQQGGRVPIESPEQTEFGYDETKHALQPRAPRTPEVMRPKPKSKTPRYQRGGRVVDPSEEFGLPKLKRAPDDPYGPGGSKQLYPNYRTPEEREQENRRRWDAPMPRTSSPSPYDEVDDLRRELEELKQERDGYAGGGVVRGPVRKPFDPNGPGYDDETAEWEGVRPEIDPEDGKPHGMSRVPRTGLQLKGRQHPTWDKAIETDRRLGYGLEMRDGRYYTTPFDQKRKGYADGGVVEEDPDSESELVIKSLINRDIGEPGEVPPPDYAEDRAAHTINRRLNAEDMGVPQSYPPLSEWHREGEKERTAQEASTAGAQKRDAQAFQTSAPTVEPKSRLRRAAEAVHDFVSPPGAAGQYEHDQRQRERIRQATPGIAEPLSDAELGQRTRDMETAYRDVAGERNEPMPDTGPYVDAARRRAAGALALVPPPTSTTVPLTRKPQGEPRPQPRALEETGGTPEGERPSGPYPTVPLPDRPEPAAPPAPSPSLAMSPESAAAGNTREPNQTPRGGVAVAGNGVPVQGSNGPPTTGNNTPGGAPGSQPAPPQQALNVNAPSTAPKGRKALDDRTRTEAYDPVLDANDPRNVRAVDPSGRTYGPDDVRGLVQAAATVFRPGPNGGQPVLGQGAVRPQTYDAYAAKHTQGGKLSKGEALLVGMVSDFRMLMKQGRVQQASLMAAGLLQAAAVEAAAYGQSAAQAYQSGDMNKAGEKFVQGLNNAPDGMQHLWQNGTIVTTNPYTGEVTARTQVTPQQLLAGIMGLQDGSSFWAALQSAATMFSKPDKDAEGRALSNEIKRRQIGVLDRKLAGGGAGAGGSSGLADINARIAALGGGTPAPTQAARPQGDGDDTFAMSDPGSGSRNDDD